MQFLGTLCKAEQGCHVKRNRRQNRQYNSHRSQRQLTWFRRERDVIWLNKPDYDYDDSKILDVILNEIDAAGWQYYDPFELPKEILDEINAGGWL